MSMRQVLQIIRLTLDLKTDSEHLKIAIEAGWEREVHLFVFFFRHLQTTIILSSCAIK